MLKKINKYFYLSIGVTLIFLILGIVLCVYPKTSLTVFSYIIAIMFAVNGIMMLIESTKKITIIDYFTLGMLSLVLGILLILKPTALATIIPIIIGIWFVISGVVKVRISTLVKDVGDKNWVWSLLLAVLSVICGFILIFNPHIGAISLTLMLGILLVVNSISEIIDLLICKKHIKEFVKLLK